MSRLLWCPLLWALTTIPAFAKPNGGCDTLLTLTRATIEEFSIQPLNAYPAIFILHSEHERIGSDVGESIRARIGQRVGSLVLHTPGAFKDKRVLAEAETKDFVLIDNLESFVASPHCLMNRTPDCDHVETLRALLRKRMGANRPTLILVNQLASVNRFLLRLTERPRDGV